MGLCAAFLTERQSGDAKGKRSISGAKRLLADPGQQPQQNEYLPIASALCLQVRVGQPQLLIYRA